MLPQSIPRWILWHGNYDTAAHRQLWELVRTAHSGKGRQYAYLWRMPVFDIELARVHPKRGLDIYPAKNDVEVTIGQDGWPSI